jgi:propionyl-CoA carboxylase alpha chain
MLTSVLVANRGEIARRVFATCRRAGYASVAIFSDADANAPHVADADAAVRLPGSSSAETYLRGDLIIQAARAAGADAIHPGYGFLSENAEFARAVIDAGLTWVGPPVAAIEAMGSKVEAKKLMAHAGVPVLPELDAVTAEDLPVLVKASAGGGGRGMRVVRTLAELPEALAAARREAQSAFGNPTVFCERYLETGRHIEVQVLADRHGTVWTLGERECSIQRRHQKVIEEAPSPLVSRTAGMRSRLFEAARLAASAIGYEGAGTVEFLTGGSAGADDFYFLEMNTRLQVEHPVTECVTGLDLVALQLEIASGEALPLQPPPVNGHAIEARLYAEDPAKDWQPRSGTLFRFSVAHQVAFEPLTRPGVRLDSGVVDGSAVGVHYDPMLAKVIAYGSTRVEAARMLASALAGARLHGLTTNRDLLVRVLRHPAFLAGDTDTSFLTTFDVFEPLADASAVELSAVAAAVADAAANRAAVSLDVPSGWRNLPSEPQRKTFGSVDVAYRFTRAGVRVDGHEGLRLVTDNTATSDNVLMDVDGVRRRFDVARYGTLTCVDSPLGSVSLVRQARFTDPSEQVAAGSLLAPMPGTVVRVGASAGDPVTAGQPLVWLEAMKMEHTISAPADGVLKSFAVVVGQLVDMGAVLGELAEPEEQA